MRSYAQQYDAGNYRLVLGPNDPMLLRLPQFYVQLLLITPSGLQLPTTKVAALMHVHSSAPIKLCNNRVREWAEENGCVFRMGLSNLRGRWCYTIVEVIFRIL